MTFVKFPGPRIISDVVIARIGEELLEVVDGARKLVVDFSGVWSMSSAMIGKVTLLNKRAKAIGCKWVMCNVSPQVMGVFEVTRFNKIILILEDREAAIAKLEKMALT